MTPTESVPVHRPSDVNPSIGVDRSQSRAIARRSHHRISNRRSTLLRQGLVIADAVGITLALVVTALSAGGLTFRAETFLIAAGTLFWIPGAHLFGLYTRDARRPDYSTVEDIVPVFNLVTLYAWTTVIVISVVHVPDWGIWPAIVFWLAAPALITSARAIARAIVRRQPGFTQKTIVIGAGDVGQLVGRKIQQHPEFGIELVGFVDSAPRKMRTDLDGIPLLGGIEDVTDVVRRHDVERVVFAFSNDPHAASLDAVHSLQDLGIKIDVVPRLFEALGPVVGMNAVEGLALVALPTHRHSGVARILKRAIDLVGASIMLILTLPLFAWVAWRIKSDSPGSVFFRQERLGQDMKLFTVLKFRTMATGTDDRPHREYVATIMKTEATPVDGNLYKLEREDAVTRVGAWLRRTSLDELPQLLNVLKGEMSLVGPRPCIPYETELFEKPHFDRFLVPAGMTGLWQVEARARSTFKEALDLDAAYARNWSLLLDLWLIARTPVVMLRSRKVTQ